MEEILVRLAAPTLAGLKTGSLFPYFYENRESVRAELARMNRLLIPRGLRLVLLRLTERSALLYLFRPAQLKRDLEDRNASALLRSAGYPCASCGDCLCQLLKRFKSGTEFPHEVGLFLGYPPEDVGGFMHDRDNYKACCLWKIYGDEERAKSLCESFTACTRRYCRLWQEGYRLEQLALVC